MFLLTLLTLIYRLVSTFKVFIAIIGQILFKLSLTNYRNYQSTKSRCVYIVTFFLQTFPVYLYLCLRHTFESKHLSNSFLLIFDGQCSMTFRQSNMFLKKLEANLKVKFDSVIAHFDLIWFFVFNATFSNISAISWQPVLVVEEAGVPGENHWPWASNW